MRTENALRMFLVLAALGCAEERTGGSHGESEPTADMPPAMDAGRDARESAPDGPPADAAADAPPADAASDAPPADAAADAPLADAAADAPPADAAADAPLADGPTPDAPCGCSKIYDPVCGADGVTYDNDCYAACAGVLLACAGVCPCPGCICPLVFDPVCGTDGVTHFNPCEAECINVVIACEGECPCAGPCDPGDPATCPQGYACRCGGPGPTQWCACGLECGQPSDCTNLNQTECCDDAVCTDPCTCLCR